MGSIEDHKAVQTIAKQVLEMLVAQINERDTEETIAKKAVSLLAEHGIYETWYYDCPAFVLLGSRSCLSISGRDYQLSHEKVGLTNLITVDLSPSGNGIWGDCARTFYVEDGVCTSSPTYPEFVCGALLEQSLHQSLFSFARPETTFAELYYFANQQILAKDFVNLDFLGNVGHSIESNRNDRQYIEKANDRQLGSAQLFTFEPHIRAKNGMWGFKHENIYYFDNGFLKEL